MTLTVGSIFSGVGGFDLGLERAGCEIRWQVEIDPVANRVLDRHWPMVLRHQDVRGIDGRIVPSVDILAGGWPCQDLSRAGQRAGLAGERSGLFFEIARLAREIAPTWLLLENVHELLTSEGGRDFGTVLDSLVELGYCVAWRTLDAQHYGVAQRRQRVFLVGHLRERAAPFSVLFEPESCARHLAPRRATGEDLAGTIGSGTPGSGPPGDLDRMTDLLVLPFDTTQICSRQNGSHPQPGDPCHPVAATAHPPAIAFMPQAGGDSRLAIGQEMSGCVHASQVPAVLRGPEARRLTPLEIERLFGFPDRWTAHDRHGRAISDSARYHLLGNSVVVPVVEWIGRRLVAVAESLAAVLA